MGGVAGHAVMGEDPPLAQELKAFGNAVAIGDQVAIDHARQALLDASGGNEHAVLDAAATVSFFSSISKIVDFSGHYYDDFLKILETMCKVLSVARKVRLFVTAPFRWVASFFDTITRTDIKKIE